MFVHLTSLLLLSGLGYAAPPDKQALVLSVGSGTIHRLQLDAAAGILVAGELFGIYPEGTRARDGLLQAMGTLWQ